MKKPSGYSIDFGCGDSAKRDREAAEVAEARRRLAEAEQEISATNMILKWRESQKQQEDSRNSVMSDEARERLRRGVLGALQETESQAGFYGREHLFKDGE